MSPVAADIPELIEHPDRRSGFQRLDLCICLALCCATFAIYYQVRNFAFVNFDDPFYVAQNPHLLAGLSVQGMWWALTSGEGANWFPVTRIFQLVDYQLFGLRSGFHHLSSAIFHALAAVLLFVFLRRAAGARGPSAFVAFVFALHPLHVESVAWVSEKKDVLCAVFWFLTLWAWVMYVERPARRRYLIALALFALGLMAKPMIVTLPFVLLLLDIWPFSRALSWKLVREKVPFFALSAIASVIAAATQRNWKAVALLDKLPLGLRIENALVTWVVYIAKTLWPTNLAAIYPYPAHIPLWQAASAGLGLAAVSNAVLRARPSRPYLACGWFWYLATLVPVIGLVQVGSQARADRYMYVPMVGLSIMLAWGAADLFHRWPRALAAAAAAACVALAAVSWVQIGYWSDSVTLYRRAIAVTNGNFLAYGNLGAALIDIPGRLPEATDDLRTAIAINPNFALAHMDLGNCLVRTGQFDEAIGHFRTALRIDPHLAVAHTGLGVAFWNMGRIPDAIAEYRQALRIDPATALAHNNLGAALAREGKVAEAIAEYEAALTGDPDDVAAHIRLGDAFMTTGRTEDAIEQYEAALRGAPGSAEVHNDLGVALARSHGLVIEALPHFEAAVKIDPAYGAAQLNLGNALLQLSGRRDEGIAHLEAAYRARPDPALRERLDRLEAGPAPQVPARQ